MPLLSIPIGFPTGGLLNVDDMIYLQVFIFAIVCYCHLCALWNEGSTRSAQSPPLASCGTDRSHRKLSNHKQKKKNTRSKHHDGRIIKPGQKIQRPQTTANIMGVSASLDISALASSWLSSCVLSSQIGCHQIIWLRPDDSRSGSYNPTILTE